MADFSITPAARQFGGSYPALETARNALPELTFNELSGLVALLITEGVPHAFRSAPLVFAAVRAFIAKRLSVSTKGVTLVGSARWGYSTCPVPKFGTQFNHKSDLDLVIVDGKLFEQLAMEFQIWRDMFVSKAVEARNAREARLWSDNAKRVPMNIREGFLDPNRIPNFQRFPLARRIENTMFLLAHHLNSTTDAPSVHRTSIRVYKDWDTLMRRQINNLNRARASLRR